jgi:hypothetical protein
LEQFSFKPLRCKLLELFHKNEFEISAPQCPTNYSPAGNGDILDIVVHQNIDKRQTRPLVREQTA